MIINKIVILLILWTGIAIAQTPFFTEPRLSGTHMLPENAKILEYFKALQKKNPQLYLNLTKQSFKTTYNVGDERNFNVANLSDPDNIKHEAKLFVLKRANSLINIWVEKAELENNHVTESVIDEVEKGLVEQTAPGSYDPSKGIVEIEEEIYGNPPNIDGDNVIDFLLTDVLDGWDGEGGFVGGFFYPYDQTTNPGSNRADILYIDTYPGIYREVNGQPSYFYDNALGTVAHELQHLIHYANDSNESTWLNEGMSEIASFLCGYGLRSPALFLENANLSMVAWDNDDALLHYSRVALFSYYLYEKYGVDIISTIVKSSQQGPASITAALSQIGAGISFPDVLSDFYKTLLVNDPNIDARFTFDWEALRYMRVFPEKRVVEYPQTVTFNSRGYSLYLINFTNADSLQYNLNSLSGVDIYENNTGFLSQEYLNVITAGSFLDIEISRDYHTKQIAIVNKNGQSKSLSIQADAVQLSDLFELSYGSEEPDYVISSANTTNAVKFNSSKDSVVLKSVSFYNSDNISTVRLHLYDSEITANSNPASESILLNNLAKGNWVEIDVEDFKRFFRISESINVGVEFLSEGAMGYERTAGNGSNGKSFLKNSNSANRFRSLTDFAIGNETLNGYWLIKLELGEAAKGVSNSNSKRRFQVFPNPLVTEYQQSISIILNDPPVNSDIFDWKVYNSLGEMVYKTKTSTAILIWDTNNLRSKKLASGRYFISVQTAKKTFYTSFTVIR